MARSSDALKGLEYKQAGSFAIVGSDSVSEYAPKGDCEPLEPVADLRFALIATSQRVRSVRSKARAGEPLRIGTSYPKTAGAVLASVGVNAVMDERTIVSGGVESLPWQPERGVDALFELVQSGESLRQNRLEIVADGLALVSLVKVTKNYQ